MEEMHQAFRKYRSRVASQLIEGETNAHWKRAFELADEIVSIDSFCSGWEASRSALLKEQARTK